MGLQETFRSAAQSLLLAFGNVAHSSVYYHSLGTITYNAAAGTDTEARGVSVSASDLAAVATTKLTSQITDLSGQNIPTDDTQWFKIGGFATVPNNNDYAKATAATTTGITLSGLVVGTESSGNTITIIGPYYKISAIFDQYNSDEIQDTPIKLTDEKMLIPNNDLTPTPKVGDHIVKDGTQSDVVYIDADAALALYILAVRTP